MNDAQRINAIAGPTPLGFPSGDGFLGILTLDTRFPRFAGDIGNPASFRVPARTRVVRNALPRDAVRDAAALRQAQREHLAGRFLDALRELEREGARAIATSCGFLVLLQAELQAATAIPVVTSSLLMLPALLGEHAQVGVLTISAADLGPAHFEAAGVEPHRLADVVVEGVAPGGEFAGAILGNREAMDYVRAQADVVAAARRLQSRAPHLTELVLECTNMPPHAKAVENATGLRTWSLLQCERLLAPFRKLHAA